MDIQVDEDFNIFFDSQMKLVEDNDRQKFLCYLRFPKNSLFWDLEFGINHLSLLELSSLGNPEALKAYYISLARNLGVNLWDIQISYDLKGNIVCNFSFQENSLTQTHTFSYAINARDLSQETRS